MTVHDDDAVEWDARYAEHVQQMWSGRPNGSLVVEVGSMTPRRALDVGCGEGADAIWLASRGWRVTALDVSRIAIDRAVVAAAVVGDGVDIEWRCADLTVTPPERESYDLVCVQYPAFRKSAADAVADALAGAVAPGGTLLLVGHGLTDEALRHAHDHGFDPADYVSIDDVRERLGAGWTIEVDETRPRPNPPDDSRHADDAILRARRTAAGHSM